MGKSLIITEKPSVAVEFAKVLQVSGRKDGYIENDKYVITWCVGHLVGMVYPESYDEKYKKWKLEDLPFLPRDYKYDVIKDVAKQYDIVHGMLHREDIDRVYWAGDAGKEGQTIEENIRNFGGVREGMEELRVWIDSQTEEEILRGIREAKPMSDYANLGNSGIMRTIEDYAMGINFSRVMSVKYGNLLNNAAGTTSYTAIAVGRVMTCVLGMVVIREREIRNFKETPFYRVVGTFTDAGIEGEWKAMVIFSSDNWLYDGPVCIDARCFNILMSGSNGVIRNYKAVSSMMNTDGITIGGKNHLVEHCFMYVGDNGLVISNATNTVFRDITIGTTCAAIFPQLTNTGILLEDIYIFRSNDGILNNFYNNDNTTARKAEITIKNLDCVDCINLPHFFRGEKVGELDKVYNFINVSLPSICGSSDPHNSWMTNTKRLVLMKNTDGTLFTQNYTLNFTNLYIDGSAVKSKEDVLIEDKWENTYTFNNDGTYKPGFCKTYEANSTADDKVYLGAYQVHFDADIVREAGTVYLPADEVLHMLLVDSKPATVKIGDISYVSLDALEAASAIEGYAVTSSGIYLIPVQNGQNLLFPEEGEVSHFSEINCYQVDLVLEFEDGNPVYYMHNYKNRNTGGISRFIHNELKMYGQGKYEFTFKIKGSGDGTVNIATMYDTTMSSTKKTSSLSVSEDWDSYTVTIDATSDIISCESFFISITGTSDAPLDYFVIKDFRLTKVS